MSVVVIGDANVDLEIRLPSGPRPDTHANPDPQLFGGGSAANTAAALARLGVPCRFVGAVGDDGFGRFAVESLAQAGVDISAIAKTAESPTVAVIAVVQPDGDRLIYVWPPQGGAHAALEPRSTVAAIQGAAWLHVSGICLRVAPARYALLGAMERARSDGIPVSFDLNLRLENWGWDSGFAEAVEAAIEQSDVVLGAASDEIVAIADIADPTAAAASLVGERRVVVARLGADGAVACSPAETVSVPGFAVPVIDTVGAGDAFNAGFIAACLRDLGLRDAVEWGNAVAGLTIAGPGARSTPVLPDVEALLDR
jgi:sugar/nucleoside kinase (ribokinase family)